MPLSRTIKLGHKAQTNVVNVSCERGSLTEIPTKHVMPYKTFMLFFFVQFRFFCKPCVYFTIQFVIVIPVQIFSYISYCIGSTGGEIRKCLLADACKQCIFFSNKNVL